MTSVCVLLLLALVINVNIRVSGQPSIQSSSSLFIAGQERILVCYVSSTETYTSFPLRWSKDGQLLSASNEESVPGSVTKYNSFYKLMVQPSDNEDVYVCTATFPSGQTASSFKIYVYKGSDTPVISGPSLIVTGQSVSWTCVVDGASSTAPNVYWQFGNATRRDSGLFNSSHQVYVDTNDLEIHKVTSVLTMTVSSGSPSFNLSCQAIHFETSTKATADVTVTVKDPPVVSGGGTNYTVTTGNDVTIACSITSSPAATSVTWYKDGAVVLMSSSHYAGATTSAPSLIVNGVTKSDTGYYVCSVSNSLTSVNGSANYLNVRYIPIISYSVNPVVGVQGSDVTLSCVIDANPTYTTVYWYTVDSNGVDTQIYPQNSAKYSGGTATTTPALTIHTLTSSDAGFYRCVADNNVGRGRGATLQVQVNFLTAPPVVTGGGTNLTVTTGSDVTIACSITSSPAATSVKWYKDGAVVLMSNSHYAGATILAPSLIVNGVTKSDTGYYVCSASNSIASANGSANYLNVRYIPIITYSANPVGGVQGSDVTLSCVIDANPTYTTVYWYSVDSNGVDTVIYTQNSAKYSGGTATTTSALTIHNLTSSDAGFYRCVVDNIVGRGRGATLQVQGNYQPEALNFKIGSTSDDNVTVSENDRVTLTCQADAVPVATLTLTGENGGQLKSGQSPLSHVVERARCEDTGQYVCSATNSLGQADNTVTKTLLVRCSPRSTDTHVGTLNFLNTPTTLEFDVTAYPAPSTSFTFAYTGVSGTEVPREVKDVDLRAACGVKPGSLNQFTCTVTLMSMTSSHAQGYYVIVVSNSQGLHNYIFQLLYNGPTPQPPDNGGPRVQDNAVAVGGGVAAAVAVVVIAVVVIVIVLKRHRALKRTPTDYLTPVNPATVSPPLHPERAPPSSSFTDIQMQQAAWPVYDPQRPYDQLNMSDVGQRSLYSDFGHQNAGYHYIGHSNHASPSNRGQDDANPYDDLDDVGQTSLYSQLKPNTVPQSVDRKASQPGDDYEIL